MTVAARPSIVAYYEDGVSRQFAVPFRFPAGELVVQRIVGGAVQLLLPDTDYSIAGGQTDAGGTVTCTISVAGAMLRILRATVLVQPMDYTTGDRFPAVSHEGALDRQMMAVQDVDANARDGLSRALLFPVGETAGVLPVAPDRRGKVLTFDPVTGAPKLVPKSEFPEGPPGPPGPNDGLRPGLPFISNYTDDVIPEGSGQIYLTGTLGTSIDLLRLDGRLLPGVAAYPLHITFSADEGVMAGGSMGIAISGPGVGSAATFNRYEDGPGNGALGQRVGSGDGYGLYGSFAGTGRGAGIGAIKQNANGSIEPGQPHGLGPALEATNSSEQGPAIQSLTTANNASLVSNTHERRNVAEGIVSRDQILLGGARTGLVTGHDVIIQPDTDYTGVSPVSGINIVMSDRIKGSATAAGLTIINASGEAPNGYGAIMSVTGLNDTNTALVLSATNATNNRALLAFGGISLDGNFEPTADNSSNIGRASLRFATIYAGTGTINTSDAREKHWLGNLTDAHLRAARRIGPLMGLFQWHDQIADKGEDGARIHFGAKAQDIVEIFYDEGLEHRPAPGERPDFRHAFLCYDEWADTFEDVMGTAKVMKPLEVAMFTGRRTYSAPRPYETGEVEPDTIGRPEIVFETIEREVDTLVKTGERLVRAAGHQYGLRHDQLALFLAAAQAVEVEQLAALVVDRSGN